MFGNFGVLILISGYLGAGLDYLGVLGILCF